MRVRLDAETLAAGGLTISLVVLAPAGEYAQLRTYPDQARFGGAACAVASGRQSTTRDLPPLLPNETKSSEQNLYYVNTALHMQPPTLRRTRSNGQSLSACYKDRG